MQDAGLKVVLTGEGADELFAGYDVFRENKVRRFWARDPESQLRPLLFARLNAFLAQDLGRSGAFLASFYAARARRDGRPALQPSHPVPNTPRAAHAFSTPASSSARAPPATRSRG